MNEPSRWIYGYRSGGVRWLNQDEWPIVDRAYLRATVATYLSAILGWIGAFGLVCAVSLGASGWGAAHLIELIGTAVALACWALYGPASRLRKLCRHALADGRVEEYRRAEPPLEVMTLLRGERSYGQIERRFLQALAQLGRGVPAKFDALLDGPILFLDGRLAKRLMSFRPVDLSEEPPPLPVGDFDVSQ